MSGPRSPTSSPPGGASGPVFRHPVGGYRVPRRRAGRGGGGTDHRPGGHRIGSRGDGWDIGARSHDGVVWPCPPGKLPDCSVITCPNWPPRSPSSNPRAVPSLLITLAAGTEVPDHSAYCRGRRTVARQGVHVQFPEVGARRRQRVGVGAGLVRPLRPTYHRHRRPTRDHRNSMTARPRSPPQDAAKGGSSRVVQTRVQFMADGLPRYAPGHLAR